MEKYKTYIQIFGVVLFSALLGAFVMSMCHEPVTKGPMPEYPAPAGR